MLVSFSNSTDRWSRFGLKVVLISPPLWGEMGKVNETTSSHWLERKSSELFVPFFFTLRHLTSRTKSADSGLCLFRVNKLSA